MATPISSLHAVRWKRVACEVPDRDRLGQRCASRHGQRLAPRAPSRCVTVEAEHPGGLIALTAPWRPGRLLGVRRQSGRYEPGREHGICIADAAGVRPSECRERLRCPARLQRRQHSRGQPRLLGCGKPPALAECGEELPLSARPRQARPLRAASRACAQRRRAVLRIVRVQPLHPVAALIAPRRRAGCTPSRARGAMAAPRPRYSQQYQPPQQRGAIAAPRSPRRHRPAAQTQRAWRPGQGTGAPAPPPRPWPGPPGSGSGPGPSPSAAGQPA